MKSTLILEAYAGKKPTTLAKVMQVIHSEAIRMAQIDARGGARRGCGGGARCAVGHSRRRHASDEIGSLSGNGERALGQPVTMDVSPYLHWRQRMTNASAFETFRRLHENGVLLLANAWDAGTARLTESLGAQAIATTSAGVAWSHGYADGDHLPVSRLVATVTDILRVVRVPLSVDIEGGYSDDPATVAETVARLADVGVAGINLEDGNAAPDLLCAQDRTHQARVRAGRHECLRQCAHGRLSARARTCPCTGRADAGPGERDIAKPAPTACSCRAWPSAAKSA